MKKLLTEGLVEQKYHLLMDLADKFGYTVKHNYTTKNYNKRISNKNNQLVSQEKVLAIRGDCAWCVLYQLGKHGFDYNDFIVQSSDDGGSSWIVFPFTQE